MNIHFIGIGGTAIGPLALIAHQMGHKVSGSDKQDSQYIEYLKKHGINDIYIGNDSTFLAEINTKNKIDQLVHSSAVSIENPNHPEISFAKQNNILITKRDDLLNKILKDSGQKMIAIAGTHGKTTTTAMAVWLFKHLNIPISYSVGAKISFGDMGSYNPESQHFVYECDEFDRNFLSFSPEISLITGVDYDHHDIYASREEYVQAFQEFIDQSARNVVWQSDIDKNNFQLDSNDLIINDNDEILNTLSIIGKVNRRNAFQVMECLKLIYPEESSKFKQIMEQFPGLSRRFEELATGLYSDYAHTPPKIAGCLQLAKEVGQDNIVIVYEPLTNRRQYYIKDEYRQLFSGVKKLYWVPTYLAREDPNETVLSPSELIKYLDNKEVAEPAEFNENLKINIKNHLKNGDLVVCISGGGGGSLDEWLRQNIDYFKQD